MSSVSRLFFKEYSSCSFVPLSTVLTRSEQPAMDAPKATHAWSDSFFQSVYLSSTTECHDMNVCQLAGLILRLFFSPSNTLLIPLICLCISVQSTTSCSTPPVSTRTVDVFLLFPKAYLSLMLMRAVWVVETNSKSFENMVLCGMIMCWWCGDVLGCRQYL